MENINKDSRTIKSIKNALWSITNQSILFIANFGIRTLFIIYLGIELLGVNSILTTYVTMLSIIDLGFSSVMMFLLYSPISKRDHSAIYSIYCYFRRIYNKLFILYCTVGFIFSLIVPFLINKSTSIEYGVVLTAFLLLTVNGAFTLLATPEQSIIIAEQKQYKIKIILTVSYLIQALIQSLTLIFFQKYFLFLLAYVVFSILNYFLIRKLSFHFISKTDNKNIDITNLKTIKTYIKNISIYKVASILYGSLENVMISLLGTVVIAGKLSNYYLIFNALIMMITVLFASLSGSLGNLNATASKEKKHSVFMELTFISDITSSLLAVGFFLFINDFIIIWLGFEYTVSYFIIFAMFANMLVTVSLQPLWIFRETTGLFNQTKNIMIYTLVINLILSIILGKLFGIFGIMISTVISRLITYYWYEPIILFKVYFEKSSRTYFFTRFNLIFFNLVFAFVLFTLKYNIKQFINNPIGNLIFEVLIYGFILLAFNILIRLKSDQLQYVFMRVLKIIGR